MADLNNPVITVVSPTPGSKNNPQDALIVLEIKDITESGSGVNTSSLNVVISGGYAFRNGVLQSGYDGYYTYAPYPDTLQVFVSRDAYYSPLESVNVAVSARDFSTNPAATRVFSFFAFDNVAPAIVNFSPTGAQVTPSLPIKFSIRSTPQETTTDITTLNVSISGLEIDAYGDPALDAYGQPTEAIYIQSDGYGNLFYDQRIVSISADLDGLGYSITIQPLNLFPFSSKITTNIQVADEAGNVAQESFFFTTADDNAPILLDPLPAPDSVGNSIASVVSFTIGDRVGAFTGSGLDLTSVTVKIDGQKAIESGNEQTGFSAFITPHSLVNGYDFIITNSSLYTPRKTINVDIFAADFSGNVLATNYIFTTEDVIAPTINFITPRTGASSGLSQSTSIIVDFVSEVAVGELDVSSIVISLNGLPAFNNNTFQSGYSGFLSAASSKILTVTLVRDTIFSLGENLLLDASVSDIFGNNTNASINFSITTTSILKSEAYPPPGIFDKTDSDPNFPGVGSYLDVTLSASNIAASIAYTTDGSDPVVDGYFQPLNSTQIYSAPIRIINLSGSIIRFFAFNSLDGMIEDDINNAVYFFSNCAEVESWDDFGLRDGNEYTARVKLNKIIFSNSTLFAETENKFGIADYIHDLGRVSFIDSLEFTFKGIVRFRVRIADNIGNLLSTKWLNALYDLATNQLVDIYDGYGPKVTNVGNDFNVIGRSQSSDIFGDDAYGELNELNFPSFVVNADMRLQADLDSIVGSRSFLRIKDDVHTLEVQQYVSKVSTASFSLSNQNSLVHEDAYVYIDGYLVDAYSELTDGYDGFIKMIQPPLNVTESLNLIETLTTKFTEELPMFGTDIFKVVSSTPSVYNQFVFSDGYDGYLYSSALVKEINYKRSTSATKINFFIPVIGKPLDSTTAQLHSDNFNSQLDKFIPAETNNVFTGSLFSETGDYLFRVYVEREGDSRIIGNPFQFVTKQDLSSVLPNDTLIVGSQSYKIASVVSLINGSYAIEFESSSPVSEEDIVLWSIKRGNVTLISATEEIKVLNPLGVILGEDASGLVANLIVNERKQINFTYFSSTATKVSIIGSFTLSLVEQLDAVNIEKAFDGDLATKYTNAFPGFHKAAVSIEDPIIVDRVRFYTNVEEDAYQRVRLLLDDQPVAKSNYVVRDSFNNPVPYLSNIDVYADKNDGFIEWKYNQIANNKNTKRYHSIGIQTRFDTFKQAQREHVDVEVFTIPNAPLLITDYFAPLSGKTLYRNNKTGFASVGNDIRVEYGSPKYLASTLQEIYSVFEEGILDNFLQTKIVVQGPDANSVYVENPNLFKVGEQVISNDGFSSITSTIIDIPQDASGLIIFSSPVHTQGFLVKSYIVEKKLNNYEATLEVPKFTTAYVGLIKNIVPGVGVTTLVFEDLFNQDISNFVRAKLTYPLLVKPSKILNSWKSQEQSGPVIENLLNITIDQELPYIHPELGAVVEVFNSTKRVVDYIIENDGYVTCLNQSELCLGKNVEINYGAVISPYQAPEQMLCLDGYSMEIIIEPSLFKLTLKEVNLVNINFFNGVESQAPTSLIFTINDAYSITQTLTNSVAIEGYDLGFYDPSYPETGQILEFSAQISDIMPDAYLDDLFTSLKISFSGQSKYCIGEIKAVADSTIVNSRCRVVLDEQELFLSDLPVSNSIFSHYEIQIDRGSLIIFFNQTCIIRRPLLFTDPKFQFGGGGKVLDDLVTANFKNIRIDQYFDKSPAKIQQVGRFIEIEGTVVS